MARKGWTALKQDYRERLERNGITRADYERGESLKKGRGHAHTPERPSQKHTASQFPSYDRERKQLIRDATQNRAEAWKDVAKFNVSKAGKGLDKRPMNDLKWLARSTPEEIRNAVIENPEKYGWAGYHP